MKTVSIGNKTRFIVSALLLIISLNRISLAQNRIESDGEIVLLKKSNTPSSSYSPYMNAFASMGLKLKTAETRDFKKLRMDEVKVMIIPSDAAGHLKKSERKTILDFLRKGMNVITEDRSLLSEEMGIKFSGKSKSVGFARDLNHPEVEIKWRNKCSVKELSKENFKTFCIETETSMPLAIGGSLEKGKFIYLALPLGKAASFGYERFPYFHEYFFDHFNYKPFIRSNRLVSYVDYGFHEQDSPDELALSLRKNGIAEVHLSGWYTSEKSGVFFRSFIEECHKNGILVYLWLELPMVSEEFWNLHPEWRQKTALGQDAALDWRKLMALEIPECFNAVKDYLKQYIKSQDWDGVDIAELYFESLVGYTQPEAFTPMNSYVREEFKKKWGMDPIKIFTPGNPSYYRKSKSFLGKFLNYRAELCTELNRKMLEFIYSLKDEKHLDIYLTQIDNPLSKNIKNSIGVKTEDFVNLQKEFSFTMQAEDPYPLWVLGPDRYKKIGDYFRKKLGPDATLTLDINVVDEGRDDPYPTPVQTGLELMELIREASRHSDRVCIYADNTPYPYDYKYSPYALGSSAEMEKISETEYVSNSSGDFIFEGETSWPEVKVNGNTWPLINNKSVILPSGKNRIEFSGSGMTDSKEKIFITSLSCEIKSAARRDGSVEISYDEKRNVYISLSKKPGSISLNGKKADFPEYLNPLSGEYTYKLPAGENKIIFGE